jgi:uncharacterized protein YjbI with pentapeptide repeats
VRRLVNAYRPASTISQEALDAHAAWLGRGGKGGGYLTIEGKQMVEEFYGPINLTFASIVDCNLAKADLGYAILDEANLDRVVFTRAILNGASITNAVIKGGTWTRAYLSIAKFNAAEITGTDFFQADLERTQWYGAKVRGARFDSARFGNAVFDRARFEGCSFRHATFHTIMPDPPPTSRGAHFVDCDFGGVNLVERDFSDTTFVRCRLAGARGPAQPPQGLVLQDCDLDLETFLQGRTAQGSDQHGPRPDMRVVAHGPHAWFLLEASGSYYLSARCTNSATEFDIILELTSAERDEYRALGAVYIDYLAARVNHWSSEYLTRDAKGYRAAVDAAIASWQSTRN